MIISINIEQANLGTPTNIHNITTRGYPYANMWCTEYYLEYSNDSITWHKVHHLLLLRIICNHGPLIFIINYKLSRVKIKTLYVVLL